MRKLLNISGLTLVGIALAAAIAYGWFIQHAGGIVRQFLHDQSNGNINLEFGTIRYDLRAHRLTILKPELTSKKGNRVHTSYIITGDRIVMKTGSLRRMLFSGQLFVDSIRFEKPVVEVVKLKPGERKTISIPEEIARVYTFMENAFENLEIRHLEVQKGTLSIRKQYEPQAAPVRITDIDLIAHDIRVSGEPDGSQRLMFSDRIYLESRNQNIRFPDGNHGLRFSRFKLNTQTRRIELDSCFLYGNRTDSAFGSFSIFFDSLQIRQADLQLLASKDIIKADSALCINPDIRFMMELKNMPGSRALINSRLTRDSIEKAVRELVGNIDIDYIGVQRATVDIRAKRGDQESRYSSQNSNFSLQDLTILRDSTVPIHVGRFDLEIRKYVGYSADSLYAIRFDSIQLVDNKISLNNFSIRATPRNNNAEWKEVKMRAFRLQDIDWTELLFNNRIKAGSASLVMPSVELDLTRSSPNRKKQKGSLYLALSGFRKKMQMDRLLLEDAAIQLRSVNGSLLRMNGFNTEIDVAKLLASGDAADLIGSLGNFNFRDGTLTSQTENISLIAGRYKEEGSALSLGEVTYTNNRQPLVISAVNVLLQDVARTENNQISASQVNWAKADIRMNRNRALAKQAAKDLPLLIGWSRTLGLNTQLSILSGDARFTTHVSDLQTGPVLIPADGQPRINGLDLKGTQLLFEEAGFRSSIGSFRVLDEKTSLFEDIRLRISAGKHLVNSSIPRMYMTPDLESFIDNKPSLSNLLLEDPVISILPNPDGNRQRAENRSLPSFTIGELQVSNPVIRGIDRLLPPDLKILFDVPVIKAMNVRSNTRSVSMAKVEAGFIQLGLQQGQFQVAAETGKGAAAQFSNLLFTPADRQQKSSLSFHLDRLTLPAASLDLSGEDGTFGRRFGLESIRIADMDYATDLDTAFKELLRRNVAASLTVDRIRHQTLQHGLTFSGLGYRAVNGTLTLDSMHLKPLLDRDSFTRQQSFQKAQFTLQTGALKAEQFDLSAYLNSPVLLIPNLTVDQPVFSVFKDRTLPFLTGVLKPMPTAVFSNLPVKFDIDTLILRKGNVMYEEINDKTGKPGRVNLSNLDARIKHLKNVNLAETDSLELTVRTSLQDTALIRMRYRESYLDSLHGFRMLLRVGRFSLPALNGMLEPIASARILSGRLDTVRMEATGNNYLAYGQMQMNYRDLKVQYLNREDYSKKTVLTRMVNFLANSVLLRKGNLKRSGTVYTDRNLEKSVFNYWIRITLSGILTSAGIRSNDKEARRFNRTIKKKGQPRMTLTEPD